MIRRTFAVLTALILVQLSTSILVAAEPSSAKSGSAALSFQAVTNGEFRFDTGILRGTLRAGGKSDGLMNVVHIPTGTVLDHSKGLFGHYRVFTVNKRYGGGAWDWESTARLLEDGSVEAHWPAAEGRPFELWAVYRWSGPATLDLLTKVQAQTNLIGFESFLGSYFKGFSNALVWAKEGQGKPQLVPASLDAGIWQMFPRDEQSVRLIKDGRWTILPSPVDWVIRPRLEAPLAIRRHSAAGLAAVIMAPREDTYAVATPHHAENHCSLYLAQFGCDLKPGETATAHARIVITTSLSESEFPKLYKRYLSDLLGTSKK